MAFREFFSGGPPIVIDSPETEGRYEEGLDIPAYVAFLKEASRNARQQMMDRSPEPRPVNEPSEPELPENIVLSEN